MAGTDRRVRSRIIVDKKLQLGMALQIMGYVYFYLVLFSLLANSRALWTVIAGTGDEAAWAAAVQRLHIFVQVFVLPLAFTFICMCLHGLIFTHRLAGPIYRFKKILRRVREGDLAQEVSIRENDYFHDLCDEMNAVIGGLREEMLRFRELSRELADEGESLAAGGDLPPEAREKLIRITNASTRLRQLMDCYRLEREETPARPACAPVPEPAAGRPA